MSRLASQSHAKPFFFRNAGVFIFPQVNLEWPLLWEKYSLSAFPLLMILFFLHRKKREFNST